MHVNVYADDLKNSVFAIQHKSGFVGFTLKFGTDEVTLWAKTILDLIEKFNGMSYMCSLFQTIKEVEANGNLPTDTATGS